MFHGVVKVCRSFGGEMAGKGFLEEEEGAVKPHIQEKIQPRQEA